MLELDGNKILVAQNSLGGFGADTADLSNNGKPTNIAFSAELNRARETISDKAIAVNQKSGAPGVLDQSTSGSAGKPVGDTAVNTAVNPESKPTATSVGIPAANQPTSSATQDQQVNGTPQSVLGSATNGLQSLGNAEMGVAKLKASFTGLPVVDPANGSPTTTTLPNLASVVESDAAPVNPTLLTKLTNTTDEAGALLQTGIEALSTDGEPEQVVGLKVGTTPGSEHGKQGAAVVAGELLNKGADESLSAAPASKTAGILPADTAVDAGILTKGLTAPARKPGIVDAPLVMQADAAEMAKAADIAKAVEIAETNTQAQATAVAQNAAITGIAENAKKTTTLSSSDAGIEGVSGAAKNVANEQAGNAALLYKPSAALASSGLGRTSVALNSGATQITSGANPALNAQPTVGSTLSTPAPLTTGQPLTAVTNPLAATNAVEVATVPGHEFLRSVAGAPSEIVNGKVINPTPVAGTVVSADQAQANVSLQASSNVASAAAVTATAQQVGVTEVVTATGNAKAMGAETSDATVTSAASITAALSAEGSMGANADSGGSKNANPQLAQAVVTTVDEEIALAQQREALVAGQQNKVADVTPAVARRQVAQTAIKPEIAGLQTLNTPADVAPSNVYHVTSNGIISANSSPLNTAVSGDIISAPRTVFLDQPDADQSFVENLRWAVSEKLSRATINVTPANLGPITVSVDVENQNMNVSIITNSAASKEAIDTLLPRMREHFANEGYQQFSVDVSSQQERQANQREQSSNVFEQDNGDEASFAQGNEPTQGEARFTTEQRRSSNSLIDTYA